MARTWSFLADPRTLHWLQRIARNPRVPPIALLGRMAGRGGRPTYYGVQWLLVSTVVDPWQSLVAESLPTGEVSRQNCEAQPSPADLPALRTLFDLRGSDKGSHHGYSSLYELLLPDPRAIRLLVEIGIGSNDSRIPSNMGPSGVPGASLRAFRDWGVGHVLGADIDSSILVQEDRIECFRVDQLSPPSFATLKDRIRSFGGFDFAVVDGLHSPFSDLSTLIELLPLMSAHGICVVEDVEKDAPIMSIWAYLIDHCPKWLDVVVVPFEHANALVLCGSYAAQEVRTKLAPLRQDVGPC